MNELTSFSVGDEDELSGFTVTGWYLSKIHAKNFVKVITKNLIATRKNIGTIKGGKVSGSISYQ